MRLARPVRSTDGRYVVAGWRADTYVAGTPEPRHDEVVSSAVRLHEATAKLERPRFLTQPPVAPWADVDVFIAADRAAWEERPLHSLPQGARVSPGSPDGQRSVELITQLASLRRPTKSPNQLVHGDLYGTVLFAGTAAPGITDITPYWRPSSWAAGVVVVDALSWGEADDGLIERWSPLPEWPQMLLRALVASIPAGQVSTYGDIADAVGLSSPRIVGWIMRTDSSDLPWHRVIRASGRPAPHLTTRQLELLRAEGVLASDGRINLSEVRHEF